MSLYSCKQTATQITPCSSTHWEPAGSKAAFQKKTCGPEDKLSTSQQCLPFQQRPAASLAILARKQPAGQGKWFFPQRTLVRSHQECSVQYWAPAYKNGVSILEWVQQRATTILRVLGWAMCVERLRELGSFCLKERQLKGNLTDLFNDLMEEHRQHRAKFFSEFCRRMRGYRYSWIQKILIPYKKNCFILRVVKH